MASFRPGLLITTVVAVVVVLLGAFAFIRPSLVGFGDDEVAEFVLLPLPTAQSEATDPAVERTVGLIEARAEAFGAESVEISREDDKIVVGVPEGDGADALVQRLTARGRIEVFDYEANLVGQDTLDTLIAAIDRAGPAPGIDGHFYLFDPSEELVVGPVFGRVALDAAVTELLPTGPPDGSTERSTPPGRFVAPERRRLSADSDPTRSQFHVLRARPALDNDDIEQAFVSESATGEGGDVTIRLTSEGGAAFREMTAELARRGQILQTNQTFAVVLDDEIISRPFIDHQDSLDGISGNRLMVQGNFTMEEAERLVDQLNLDPLPLQLEILLRR